MERTNDRNDSQTPPASDLGSAIEHWLVRRLAERLGMPATALDTHQPLVRYGLDSIVALELVADLEDWLGCTLPLTLAWDCPTITAIVQRVAESASQRIAQDEVGALSVTHDERQCSRTTPATTETTAHLSYGQQALWFFSQQAPHSPVYNIARALRVHSLLDIAALHTALQQLTDRHAALRTTFPTSDGKAIPRVHPHLAVAFHEEDATTWSHAFLQHRLTQQAHQPFTLEHGPLFRVHLYSRSSHEHVLLLVMHHMIVDFWSLAVLVHELGILYQALISGTEPVLPPLSSTYIDYVRWQTERLNSPAGAQLWAYWQQQLAGELPTLNLPTDRPRPPVQTYAGASQSRRLSAPLTQQLKALSQAQDTTLYTTLLTAFYVLLYRYTGQEDLLVGSPMAGRSRAELARLVGYVVNPVALRAHLAGNSTFTALLAQVRQTVLEAFEHQDYPFALLVERLRVQRDASRSPLFQVMFMLHKAHQLDTQDLTPFGLGEEGFQLEIGELRLESMALEQQAAAFDLTLTMAEVEGELAASLQYNTALFDQTTMECLLAHFQILLEGIVADPQQQITRLPLCSAEEQHQILTLWNNTDADYPRQQCVHQLFEAQAAQTPDAVAVLDPDERLTYRELNQRANQLAHYLRQRGVGPEVLVGLCMERSVAMVVGVLGILKAGGAYVPLDPTYPRDRLAFLLADSQVALVLTQQPCVSALPVHDAQVVCLDTEAARIAQESQANPVHITTPEHLAYVLYTSGSTGQPKGVLGLHRGIVNRLAWMWQAYPFAAADVACQKTSLNFVDSVWELFGPLLQGIPTVLIPDRVVKEPQHLVHTLAAHQVTRLVLVPSLLGMILDLPDDLQTQLSRLTLWICSGEPLSGALSRRFHQRLPQGVLLNLYGSSEVAADVTWYDTSLAHGEPASMPIGRPIANTQIYLLDAHQQPVPMGVPGELYAGGDGLARGYLHRPELTAARFIPHPFSNKPGARLYKTGDLARYRPDATLELLGRLDQQVKLRGFRIELGEIEAVLNQHPAVREVVVTVREDIPGGKQLVAYLTSSQQSTPTPSALRHFLQEKLPEYMLPAAFVILDALPLTPNGKIDRLALPVPQSASHSGGHSLVAPRTAVEQALTDLWTQLLGLEQVSIDANFFELGGHSLLAIQLLSKIHQTFGQELPLTALLQAPTIAALAALLDDPSLVSQHVLVPLRAKGTRPPVFCFHPAGGQILVYQPLTDALDADQPLYCLQSRALANAEEEYNSLDDMAAAYTVALQQRQPEGPYYLLGWSMGGLLALTVAGLLEQQGQAVAFVGLLDPYLPTHNNRFCDDALLGPVLAFGGSLASALLGLAPVERQTLQEKLYTLPPHARLQQLLHWGQTQHIRIPELPLATLQRQAALAEIHMTLCRTHEPRPVRAPLSIWWARHSLQEESHRTAWRSYSLHAVHTAIAEGNHFSMLQPPQVQSLVESLQTSLHTAQLTEVAATIDE
jgi:amino acid adenylation domain-containing protein